MIGLYRKLIEQRFYFCIYVYYRFDGWPNLRVKFRHFKMKVIFILSLLCLYKGGSLEVELQSPKL